MQIDFQRNILKYLLSDREGKQYIPLIEPNFFELNEDKVIFGLVKDYVKEYHQQPSEVNLNHFFELQAVGQPDELIEQVRYAISDIYAIDIKDFALPRAEIIQHIKNKKVKEFLSENILEKDNPKFVEKTLKFFDKVNKIGVQGTEQSEGIWLLKSGKVFKRQSYESHPCCFPSVNASTAKKGFATPELIGWAADPKLGKTVTLINLAVGFLKDGLKVYYADFENGKEDIAMRIQQCIAEATYEEIQNGDIDEILMEQMGRIKKYGGEIVVQKFMGRFSTLNDVEADLERLKDEGFVPNVIMWDYLDLVTSADKSIKDDTKISQDVAHHAIRIHEKYNCHGHTPTQVVRGAIGKTNVGMGDLGRDIGKAHNYHACFHLAQTPEEALEDTGRIRVVFQRMGDKFGEFPVRINGKRNLIVEYDPLKDF